MISKREWNELKVVTEVALERLEREDPKMYDEVTYKMHSFGSDHDDYDELVAAGELDYMYREVDYVRRRAIAKLAVLRLRFDDRPICAEKLYEDGRLIAICMQPRGTEHDHSNRTALEAIRDGVARPAA